jgi:hypothetical protein
MSVLTTLALMTSAVVAKLRESPVDVEITRLQAKVDDLNRQLTNFERDLTIARIQADRWRALVERYQGREEQQRPAGPDFTTEEMRSRLQAQYQAQQLMAMAQSQQANINAQQTQQHQALAQQNYFQGGLQSLEHQVGVGALGSQAQTLEWCNCVPARHDMFLPSGRRL